MIDNWFGLVHELLKPMLTKVTTKLNIEKKIVRIICNFPRSLSLKIIYKLIFHIKESMMFKQKKNNSTIFIYSVWKRKHLVLFKNGFPCIVLVQNYIKILYNFCHLKKEIEHTLRNGQIYITQCYTFILLYCSCIKIA